MVLIVLQQTAFWFCGSIPATLYQLFEKQWAFLKLFENISFPTNKSHNPTFMLRPVCYVVACLFSLQACSQNICLSDCSTASNKSATIGRIFMKFII